MQIRIADYPQLQLIAWNRRPDASGGEREALALDEYRESRDADSGFIPTAGLDT